MHRKKALSYIESIFIEENNTVVFYIGKYLAYESNNSSVVKVLSNTDWFSIIFGLSMCFGKKMIVVCEDFYLMRYLNSAVQIAIGKPKNIIILCLVTDTYLLGCKQNTLFNSVNSMKGLLFGAGFLVHDYTAYFKNKTELKNLSSRLRTIEGPLFSSISVDDDKMFNIGKDECNFKDFLNKIGETHVSNLS